MPPHDADSPPRLCVSIDEAARMLSVSRTTIYREISRGRITLRKIGHRSVLRLTDLDALLEAGSVRLEFVTELDADLFSDWFADIAKLAVNRGASVEIDAA